MRHILIVNIEGREWPFSQAYSGGHETYGECQADILRLLAEEGVRESEITRERFIALDEETV